MIIEFELTCKTEEEKALIDDFLKLIIASIRRDIVEDLIPSKFIDLEKSLIKSNCIQWVKPPKSINVKKLIVFILNNLKVRKRRNTYQIYFDNSVLIPNSYTNIDTVVRFIDKGNEISKYTTMFSRIFNKYQKAVLTYWENYKDIKGD